jgi:hypothetical protein
MALLSGMMRSVAIWGDTNTIDRWVIGRQGGRWADQTVRAAMPKAASRAPENRVARAVPADSEDTLRELNELRKRGVITDAEFDALRRGVRA